MRLRRFASLLAAAVTSFGVLQGSARAAGPEPIELRIVGGLAGVKQYVTLEEPFWSREIAKLTDGRVKAIVHPFDRSGLRGQDMLQLMRLGVLPFGTALVSMAAADEPLLSVADLPGLNPDFASLQRNVALVRPLMQAVLRERYSIELLAIYTYPAQVVFCAKPFASLQDLWGRRVRVSAVAQAEMFAGLGAVPIVVPFAEVTRAVRTGVVDCAVTGTLSGFESGLADVTSHIHAMPITWGISIFGANTTTWDALPEDVRAILRRHVADLERRIWDTAQRDTALGLACAAGKPACERTSGQPMTIVPTSPQDEAQRQQLVDKFVVPSWIDRCGPECERVWQETFAGALADGSPWVHTTSASDQPKQ